jgi:hypothetical protein
MKITNLESAEKIVFNNKNFSWNGWDIVYKKEIEDGYTDNKAVMIDNKWYNQKIFKLNDDGWNIPDGLIKSV